MRWEVKSAKIEGSVAMPGDKSIAHRALMFGALAAGTSCIENLPQGEDVLSTAACMQSLGAEVRIEQNRARVMSPGALEPSQHALDAGNSGTTMRLLSGILAGQPFDSQLDGDESLSQRPMRRVIDPLELMGARIQSNAGRAPLQITGTKLRGIRYKLPVASAQVKSALLLAGLYAEGQTTVIEPIPTRDHTERMLRALGVDVSRDGNEVSVRAAHFRSFNLCVPGDISSAAFLLAGGAMTGGEVEVRNVGVNPTRIGFLHVLERMGVTVKIANVREEMGEPIGDIRIRGQVQRQVDIEPEEVPQLVDEIPLIALLATAASGKSTIRGAAELRVKETDRIASVAVGLRALGARMEELPDGLVAYGPSRLRGTEVTSGGDHRLAMMLAIAGCSAEGTTVIEGAEASAVSYPNFHDVLASMGGRIAVV